MCGLLSMPCSENVDRYYQEGAGRDGGPPGADGLHEDLIWYSLNRKTYMGERGRERWSSMFAAKETLAPGRYRCPPDCLPLCYPVILIWITTRALPGVSGH